MITPFQTLIRTSYGRVTKVTDDLSGEFVDRRALHEVCFEPPTLNDWVKFNLFLNSRTNIVVSTTKNYMCEENLTIFIHV